MTPHPEEQTPKITISDLVKSFGTKKVLDGVDLNVMPGENIVVIGGSGSGKSVLLKCILGLITPDLGSVCLDGRDITHARGQVRDRMCQRCGMLFQQAALFDSLPVWENVAFGLIQSQKIDPEEARSKAIEKLAQVGMERDVADLYPAELSGGMQKRVGLARAIAGEPEIIFFDEPTTGLDPIMADVINNLIVKCVRELGATAITITHDMTSARKIADRIAMLWHGQIIWNGAADDVFCSGNPYVDQFVHGRAEGPIQMATQVSY